MRPASLVVLVARSHASTATPFASCASHATTPASLTDGPKTFALPTGTENVAPVAVSNPLMAPGPCFQTTSDPDTSGSLAPPLEIASGLPVLRSTPNTPLVSCQTSSEPL